VFVKCLKFNEMWTLLLQFCFTSPDSRLSCIWTFYAVALLYVNICIILKRESCHNCELSLLFGMPPLNIKSRLIIDVKVYLNHWTSVWPSTANPSLLVSWLSSHFETGCLTSAQGTKVHDCMQLCIPHVCFWGNGKRTTAVGVLPVHCAISEAASCLYILWNAWTVCLHPQNL
jgi:hypothetical protein